MKEKYYKVLNKEGKDPKEKDTPFQIGVKYETGWELTSTCNGFHYVKRLEDLKCNFNDSLVFECVPGKEYQEGNIFASDRIILTKQVPASEIKEYALQNKERLEKDNASFLIRAGAGHAEFAASQNPETRMLVAKYTTDPKIREKLMRDKSWKVRQQIAATGSYKELLFLRKDLNNAVRETVAKKGNPQICAYMIGDKSWQVRAVAAEFVNDRTLNKLVKTETDWRVQMAVVERGREEDLYVLAKAKNSFVRINANKAIDRMENTN